ncbi:ankyrin repeat domain-containing protein [Sporosarcina limicola]|uniref:Ankyrin repeat domain-containing protein n=1 Tax=Sporosarcina limicola TaxID=34101 RepID=A0A927MJU8_9BACL|nr:ankyrin repeat domain-containing protein [Sporosarcina limicola]MBE1555253.1 hypothetical protein [Sporosarcina limicola]
MTKEQLNNELVRSFIIAAHGDFEGVQTLLEQEPALVHSVMNWGGDDWESGLGAAAHTGNRAIVEWLLDRGARMDIFTAAMLGELPIVTAMIERVPDSIHAKGPHGIPLIRHAQMGGESALPVFEYLNSLSNREEAI